jgi:hypothetical protein
MFVDIESTCFLGLAVSSVDTAYFIIYGWNFKVLLTQEARADVCSCVKEIKGLITLVCE